MKSQRTIISLLAIPVAFFAVQSASFSMPAEDAAFALFDRFRPTCPADISIIQQFDPKLAESSGENCIWVAIFRTSNNKPSVFVRDEFLNAMRLSTGADSSNQQANTPGIETKDMSNELPVAVARLTPSTDFDGCHVLDNMRCLLKKENINPSCDGGSEHTEALCVAIDALLLHHLKNKPDRFENAIRTKSTLVSGTLLEERGFIPIDGLYTDMATHTCSLDACMGKYADRVVTTSAKGPGARERALQILSLLGQLDRMEDLKAAEQAQIRGNDDYDPWANMKSFI